jgi:hypothetical protein
MSLPLAVVTPLNLALEVAHQANPVPPSKSASVPLEDDVSEVGKEMKWPNKCIRAFHFSCPPPIRRHLPGFSVSRYCFQCVSWSFALSGLHTHPRPPPILHRCLHLQLPRPPTDGNLTNQPQRPCRTVILSGASSVSSSASQRPSIGQAGLQNIRYRGA